MITFSLQSGSNGNSIYVEAGDVRLLFDAGISGKLAEGRMRVRERDINDVDALLISHDHNDHIRCAGVYQRKFKFPIHMTAATHRGTRCHLGPLTNVQYFTAGKSLKFDGVTVHTIPTPHDATDGVGFVVEHDGKRLGILTDLGHPFPQLRSVLKTLDAAYIESNYDPHMLDAGPYPAEIKARVRGQAGHLSNAEAAELIHANTSRLKWAAIAHLSEQNTHPELAFDTHRDVVGREFPLYLASRYDVSEVLTL